MSRVHVDIRTGGGEQLGFPRSRGVPARDDRALARERVEHRQPCQFFHAGRTCLNRRARDHAALIAPTLAWKSAPLPVLATKPARMTNSPKRSPSCRSFA